MIVHVQGPFFDPPAALGRRGLVAKYAQVFGAAGATAVRCAADDSTQAAQRWAFGPRTATVWPVTNVERFATGPVAASAQQPVVLHAGSLVHRKGVDLLVCAVARFASSDRPALVIAGDGPELGSLQGLADEVGVRLEVMGRVPHGDLPLLMQRCPIFVLASRSDATPRAVMEAMAAGAAVVVTAVGDLEALVGDAGVVVPPDDVGALHEALAALLQDPSRRLALGERARQRALELFGFDRSMDRIWEYGRPTEAGPRLGFVVPALDLNGSKHFVHTMGLAAASATQGVRPSVFAVAPATQPASHPDVIVEYGAERRSGRLSKYVQWLRTFGPGDVVFVRISVPSLAVALALARLYRFRVAYWHATWKPGFGQEEGTVTERLFGFLLRRVDLFVTYPEVVKDFYVSAYRVDPGQVRLVPNNVDLGHRRSAAWPSNSRPRFLHVGHLSPRKGAEDLPAIANWLGEHAGVPLVVVGSGPTATALANHPKVLLCGPLDNAGVLDLIAAADVVVKPSYEEGCSRVVQEAASLGTPVVAYDIPPICSLLGELAGILTVPTGDPTALASKAAEVAAMNGQLSERLTALAASYSSGAVAALLVQELFGP
jgi:glycosyltransferase involved in cell wall biosynthesis